MAEKEKKQTTRIGVFLDRDLLERCDRTAARSEGMSRSEFICDAIEFYIAWLNNDTNSRVITPIIESVISARIEDTENRLARVLFKQGVEIAMMMHVVANKFDIDIGQLGALRRLCVEEVSKNSGRYSFDDAVRFQKL